MTMQPPYDAALREAVRIRMSPPNRESAADKLAAVIQAAEDANGPSTPSMADQRELQRKNQELIRRNRQLERELQKKEKALTEAATLL